VGNFYNLNCLTAKRCESPFVRVLGFSTGIVSHAITPITGAELQVKFLSDSEDNCQQRISPIKAMHFASASKGKAHPKNTR
jgi:hypothetical protein